MRLVVRLGTRSNQCFQFVPILKVQIAENGEGNCEQQGGNLTQQELPSWLEDEEQNGTGTSRLNT